MSFWKRQEIAKPLAAQPEPDPTEEPTAMDLLEESVRLLKEGLRREAAEQIDPVHQSISADEDRLQRAQETADRLGVRHALAYAIEALKHHASWIHIDEKYKTPAVDVVIRAADKRSDEGTEHTGLLLSIEGRPYVLKWTRNNFQGDIYGQASFQTEEQHTLLSIEYSTTYAHDMERIHAGVVTRLELGEWVHDLVRLAERLKTAHELQMLSFRADITANRAKDV
ncbi:hypothetical protein [Devosia elaeis]|nr:hypothetical protein [Devosia elaeis]